VPNLLAQETSPYLLQHAENPVDWFPWGEEALSKAQAEDKPILLSIGYSACHWCHVMERESFEDEETAALMNEGFVSIKVDREERPDLDSIYMRAVQASVGRGGWPLTAFLTPDGRFFYGGTYFPPESRQGMPSFRQVLTAVLDAFRNRREEIEEGSNQLLSVLKGASVPGGSLPGSRPPPIGATGDEETTLEDRLTQIGPGTLDQAARFLANQFDSVHGGFGPAPKFPQPVTLDFLLGHFASTGNEDALEMVLATLRSMASGGMRDHPSTPSRSPRIQSSRTPSRRRWTISWKTSGIRKGVSIRPETPIRRGRRVSSISGAPMRSRQSWARRQDPFLGGPMT